MYKVFINQKTIYLTQNISNIRLGNQDVLAHPHSKKAMITEFQRFINDPLTLRLFLFSPNHPKLLFQDFLSMFSEIEAAGGLVVNPFGQILFIFRYGRWDLPKGKVEAFEEKNDAAIREVEEETDIHQLKIHYPLTQTMHIYDDRGKRFIKHTWWYHMKTTQHKVPTPQKEEGITHAEWIDRSRLNDIMKNTYPSIIDVINSFLESEETALTQQD
jgi:8-oxo-dGTP pyrophosphatase MutT (NUDIX family)